MFWFIIISAQIYIADQNLFIKSIADAGEKFEPWT